MIKDAKIYSVIVSFNGAKWLRKCLASLETSFIPNEIIVVDNNSTDNSIEFIEKEFSQVTIIKQPINLGFGKANNIGISYALKQGATYVFLLNQDAYVKPETLQNLLTVAIENTDYSILSPIQLNWEGTALEHYFAQFILKNKKLYADYYANKTIDPLYEVPFVNAAAWLIPSETFKIIGGFDPIFHHYGEDNNYCQRIQYHQLKIGVVPQSIIFHDSKVRKGHKITLFSEAYFKNEVKQLQLKYANINISLTIKDRKQVRMHNLKLIVRQLFKFNVTNTLGYLKKYQIFEEAFNDINKSRAINKEKGSHYIDSH